MPRIVKPLTDTEIKLAKPKDKLSNNLYETAGEKLITPILLFALFRGGCLNLGSLERISLATDRGFGLADRRRHFRDRRSVVTDARVQEWQNLTVKRVGLYHGDFCQLVRWLVFW